MRQSTPCYYCPSQNPQTKYNVSICGCSFLKQYFVESTRAHVAETSSRSLADASHCTVPEGKTAEPSTAGSAENQQAIEQCNGKSLLDDEGKVLQLSDQNPHGGNMEAGSTSQSSKSSTLRAEAPAPAARSCAAAPQAASSPASDAAAQAAHALPRTRAAPQRAGDPESAGSAQCEGPVRLERIWVYPIKSCAGFTPSSWPLGANGLLYDRCAHSTVRCLLVWPWASVMPYSQPL